MGDLPQGDKTVMRGFDSLPYLTQIKLLCIMYIVYKVLKEKTGFMLVQLLI